MTPLTQFYIYSGVIWGSLALGALWRGVQTKAGRWTAPMLKLNAVTFPVLGFFVSFWRLDFHEHGARLLWVPILATTVSLAALWLGRILARKLGLSHGQYGAFVFSAAISNIGLTFGMPLCYALFGLGGFALAGLYTLYFPLFVYIVLFTYADRIRRRANGGERSRRGVFGLAGDFCRDPFRTLPIGAIVAGLGMNFAFGNLSIPGWLVALNRSAIYLNLLVAYLAVGFAIHLGGMRENARPIAWLCAIKFVFVPLVGTGLALAVGFRGEALAVIAIESACPVAIFAVMTAAIYGLDQELAGAALIVTTALATLAAMGGILLFP